MSELVVDLFSGCGGISRGFHELPDYYKILGAVDLEKGKPGKKKSPGTKLHCNSTYRKNIGIEPLNFDIGELDPQNYRGMLEIQKKELTVLISCAPCTGFSQKKAQNHQEDDPQNKLVEKSGEFVREFLPEFFVMENVKELLKGNQSHHFENLKQTLLKLKYKISAQVINFAHFGLPQKRIRALLIARRDNLPITGIEKKGKGIKSVREAIGHLPPITQGECHPNDPMHFCPKHTSKVDGRMKAIPKNGGSWEDIVATHRDLLIPSMMKSTRRKGSFPDVYGRLWWDKPAITITRECGHPGNGRYTHPEQDRMLSVREMAILQGFPDDYYFEGPTSAKYNQIGDAVPPSIALQIAELIRDIKEGVILPQDREEKRDGEQLKFTL
jgi:DNA (cytosine-5)-methyltransferase 1